MATLCMLVLIAIALAVTIGDIEVFGYGVGGLAISALSIGCFKLATGYDARSPWSVEVGGRDREAEASSKDSTSSRGLWLRIAFDGAVIFAAGYTLSQTGDAIAEQTGMASALVGFALIGLATSTPEL